MYWIIMKRNFKKFEIEDCDLFNTLPQHLISYIISQLPTKEAIKTSILSRKWRFYWTTISNLDFSDEYIYDVCYDEDGVLIDKAKYDAIFRCFTDYVNTVLLRLQTISVDTFSIHLEEHDDRFNFEKWISEGVKRNVRCLRLCPDIYGLNPIDLPCQVFDCKSLEALTLESGANFNIPKQGFSCFPNLEYLFLAMVDISGIPTKENSPCFPKLKTLKLDRVRFLGRDECMMKLVRNCPVLESLAISRFAEKNASNDDMCIPQLETVGLDFMFNTDGCKVEIEAPIKYLKLSQLDPSHKIVVKNPSSLMKVIIQMQITERGEQRDQEVSELIKTFQNVYSLELGHDTLDAVKASNIELPLFCNLTQLKMDYSCEDLTLMRCFLHNSVYLQDLYIKKKSYCPPCKGNDLLIDFSDVPKCLETSLKRVTIQNFNGCIHEVYMVYNILKFGKVMKKLAAPVHLEEGDAKRLQQKISAFPRASAACQVAFEFEDFIPNHYGDDIISSD